ncbi:GTPase ObgE [bacterium]|nr:GTPase ObgE [bacterium]
MKFWDEVVVKVVAGKGGDGLVSFFRERINARGGPDGGDGGDGGDVVIFSDPSLSDLSYFSHQRFLRAQNGKNGGKNRRQGKRGADLRVGVPVGTVVYEWNEKFAWQRVFDFNKPNLEFRVAKGGKGGWGNAHFVSAVRRSPRVALPGEKGERKKIKLVLKLIAEVGLIGLPNAGKSTLLSVLSSARPKIAAYPFTTLIPHLGVLKCPTGKVVIADIPGLIQGAHKGRGLGDRFLKHIERTKILVWLIDSSSSSPVEDYRILKKELSSYKPGLLGKQKILVLTKIDIASDWREKMKVLQREVKDLIIPISAATHQGLKKLILAICQETKKP